MRQQAATAGILHLFMKSIIAKGDAKHLAPKAVIKDVKMVSKFKPFVVYYQMPADSLSQ